MRSWGWWIVTEICATECIRARTATTTATAASTTSTAWQKVGNILFGFLQNSNQIRYNVSILWAKTGKIIIILVTVWWLMTINMTNLHWECNLLVRDRRMMWLYQHFQHDQYDQFGAHSHRYLLEYRSWLRDVLSEYLKSRFWITNIKHSQEKLYTKKFRFNGIWKI